MSAHSSTPLIDPERMAFLEPVSHLYETPPFDPAFEARLAAALPDRYVPGEGGCPQVGSPSRNHERILEPLAETLAETAHRLKRGATGTPGELAVYQGGAIYGLWEEFCAPIQGLIDAKAVEVTFWDAFLDRHRHFFGHPGLSAPEPGHLFALFHQARRNWYFPSSMILGGSPSALAAKTSIWWANMPSDVWSYADGLYRKMHDIPVLITGETGTGKELAAQCIGWSRYIPFDTRTRRLALTHTEDFHARSIAELSPALVESALFGHKRGSFTGALTDATGYFALPGPHGSLFLDEAGEIPPDVQAKLLRPLQSREIVRIGDSRPQQVHGRPIFATHRDLEAMVVAGEFREDLLERMNGMRVHMPPLRQMLGEVPGERRAYVRGFVAAKIDNPARVEMWTDRVMDELARTRSGYSWPRNLRELKNYTERFLLTAGHVYEVAPSAPASLPAPPSAPASAPASVPAPPSQPEGPESMSPPSLRMFWQKAKAAEISVAELVRFYVTWVHFLKQQNKAETARITGLDYRTVTEKLDLARLRRWLQRKMKKPGAK